MKIKKIRRKPKAWLYPSAIERQYINILDDLVVKLEIEIHSFCKKVEPSYRLQVRQDGFGEWLDAVFAELLSVILGLFKVNDVQTTVTKLLRQADKFNKQQFQRILKQIYGVDIFTQDNGLYDLLKLFEQQNIALIQSIPTQLHEKLRYRFVDAVRTGKRWEVIADEIQALLGTTRKRARLIARDQIGKLNGQLTQIRQKQIGVTHYIWRTSLDERVRQQHIEREGRQFSWDTPPNDGNPGEPILCRCYAEAVFPEFDELLSQSNVIVTNFGEKNGNAI